VGQLSDPFNQGESEELGFTFSGLPGELHEPDPEDEEPSGPPGDTDHARPDNGALAGDEVTYDLDRLSEMERQAATDRLREATIPHLWEGPVLHVAAEDEAAVDNILDIVEGAATPPLEPGRDQVAYDLVDWDGDQVEQLLAELRAGGLAHDWDGQELYVHADDEDAVDALFERVAGGEDGEGGENGADERPEGDAELMGKIFVAADRLQHDGDDPEGTVGIIEAGQVVEDVRAPYGVDPREWERLQERVANLVDLLIEDTVDQEEVRTQARDLRGVLRPFV
jgi:hypothetical protein